MSPRPSRMVSTLIARIRNASLPKRCNVGMRSRKSMSSSSAMRLWHELVAAGFGHQERRVRRILLDFLPQPVNMRLQRVGGDARIVAPDFLQQHLARYRILPRAVEIAKNRGFLFREAHFRAALVHEELRAGAEAVGPDREDGVFARFVASELRANAREQDSETKRLGDVIIGAGF